MNNHLPFVLEIALKDISRVVTRDGRKVSELHLFKTENSDFPLNVVIEGERISFTKSGRFYNSAKETPFDLFILPEQKDIWINIYRNGHANWHQTESDAKEGRRYSCIQTIKATITVE